jgi:hypothetical protein
MRTRRDFRRLGETVNRTGGGAETVLFNEVQVSDVRPLEVRAYATEERYAVLGPKFLQRSVKS